LIQEWTWVDHAHMKLFPMHWTKHFKEGNRKQYLTDKVWYFEKYDSYLVSYGWPRWDDDEISTLASKIRNFQYFSLKDF
jgi:hypothetical protein